MFMLLLFIICAIIFFEEFKRDKKQRVFILWIIYCLVYFSWIIFMDNVLYNLKNNR